MPPTFWGILLQWGCMGVRAWKFRKSDKKRKSIPKHRVEGSTYWLVYIERDVFFLATPWEKAYTALLCLSLIPHM